MDDADGEQRSAAGLGPSQPPEPTVGTKRSILWSVIGTALGIGLLYASTRHVDPLVLVEGLRSAELPWAVVVLGATLAFCALKAWRWGLLLRGVAHFGFRELQAAVYVGLAINLLVAHAGEVLRAAAVARRRKVAVSTIFASVVIERVLDFIAILAMLALVLVAVPDAPRTIDVAAAVSAVFVACAITSLYLFLHPPRWSTQLASRVSCRLRTRLRDRLRRQLERFREGLAPLTRPRVMAVAVIVSALQWGVVWVAIWAGGRAVTEFVSPMAATVTFVLIIVGLTLPNSPLQIGTTQLAFVVGMGTDGTIVSEAVAASLVYTAFLILPIMLAGISLVLRGYLGAGCPRAATRKPE